MATPEGKVKVWLDKMLRTEGVFFFSPQAGPHGGAGVADRIASVCGLFVAVEAKGSVKGKMTALQERFRDGVIADGGTHFLVYDKATIEEVRQFIHNVRASHSRQEDGCCSVGEPRRDFSYNTYSAFSPVEPSARTTQPRSYTSTEQPGVQHPSADPALLQLARTIQTDGPPTGDGSLPNSEQESSSP